MAGVVLAAGTSSRMGTGFKLLLPHREGVVVEAPVRAALRAGLEPVVVVTGHRARDVRRALEETFAPGRDRPAPGAALRIVSNPRYAEGQSASLARGIREVRTATDAAAAAVLVGDEPGIAAGAVRDVVEAWRRRAGSAARPPVVRARYSDRPGHPVVVPRDVFRELEAIEGDHGARRWLERNAGRVEEFRLERAAPVDVDTDDDYREVIRNGGAAPGTEGSGPS